jgi:hypothetical protein
MWRRIKTIPAEYLGASEYTALAERGQPTFSGGGRGIEAAPCEIPKIGPSAPDKIALAMFCYVGQV